MTEVTEKKVAKKPQRKPRPRPTNAIQITIWSMDGSPVPEIAVEDFESALQVVKVELFNKGYRLLTQTTKS